MIIVLDIETLSAETFTALSKACKSHKDWSYYYLRTIPLNHRPTKYKTYYIYKV